MPSPTTAIVEITKAMRLIGALAVGETPTSDEANTGFEMLNDILEGWSLENLAVWGAADQTFNTVQGQAVYTIGPGGNFDTVRPVAIFGGFCNFGGVDFEIQVIDQAAYNRIALKSQQQPIIEQMLYVNEAPLGLLTFYPTPSTNIPVTLSIGRILTQIPTLTTPLVYPPGYSRALRYALAVMIAPEFGIEPSPTIIGIARQSLGAIKVANMGGPRTMTFDGVLTGDGPAIWQRGY